MRPAEQIFERERRKPVAVDVPEWPVAVYARRLTAQEQLDLSEGTEPKELTFKIILHCIVDADGQRVFADEDEARLREEEFPVVMKVFAAAAKANGMTTKELEEAVASFDKAPDEDTYTA